MIIKLEKTFDRFEWIEVTYVSLDTLRETLYFRCASNDELEMVGKGDDVIKHVYLDDKLIFTTYKGHDDVVFTHVDEKINQ